MTFTDPAPAGPTFTAAYGSPCETCNNPIVIGDHCTWVNDHPAHVDCERPTTTRPPARPPCTSCYMVPANNGSCGCEPT